MKWSDCIATERHGRTLWKYPRETNPLCWTRSVAQCDILELLLGKVRVIGHCGACLAFGCYSHTLSLTHARCLSHMHTDTHTLSHTHVVSHAHRHRHRQAYALIHTLCLTHTYTHIHTQWGCTGLQVKGTIGLKLHCSNSVTLE